MAYRIWLRDEAKAEVRDLPGNMRQRIQHAIDMLAASPRPPGSRRMRVAGSSLLEVRRLRLDRWRIIYAVDDAWEEIGVLAIRKRPPYEYDDLDDLLSDLV